MAKINRGDIVVTRIPQSGPSKFRPFVVVQNDQNNARLTNVILAMVTSNTKLVGKVPTQVLVELIAANKSSGLTQTSAVKCENLYTVPQKAVRKIGQLPASLMGDIGAALKASLALK
jgi:mRNA-degrading endonuclease toxin of MazEF toxin-antitoxin module